MLAVLLITFFAIYLIFFYPLEPRPKKSEEKSTKYSAQMKRLWQIAQTSMKERKPFKAEKALLTILKFDEKNAAAYNRLGILYAKEKKYNDAVECFEIAQSLDNNPASIHNAGLIYYEMGAYEKAELAFQQAIQLEGDVPERYIALARAEEKLGRPKKAIEALEEAYELDPKITTLRQILTIYEGTSDAEAVAATSARIEAQIAREAELRRKRATSRALKAIKANKVSSRSKTSLKSHSRVKNTSDSKTEKVSVVDGRVLTRHGRVKSNRNTSAAMVIKSHVGRKRV